MATDAAAAGLKATIRMISSVDDPVTKTKGVLVQLPKFFQFQLEINGT
jgi:hypothetical protein